MDYKDKYFKYKMKYLELKGGNRLEELNRKLTNISFKYCDETGYKQHFGECWNDSIQTFLCFTDGLREIVQNKLWNLTAEEIIEYAELNNRCNYLQDCYKNNEENYSILKEKLITYIKLLQIRLCKYFDKIQTKSNEINSKIITTCSTINNFCPSKDFSIVDKINNQYGPGRSLTTEVGVKSAIEGINIVKDQRNTIEDSINETDHGLDHVSVLILYNILSTILLDNNDCLQFHRNIINYECNYQYLDNKLYKKIICVQIDAIFTNQENKKNAGHAIGFFKCNNISYYYNDNYGIFKFDWENFLRFYNINNYKYDIYILRIRNEDYYDGDEATAPHIVLKDKTTEECYSFENGILCRIPILDITFNFHEYYKIKHLTFITKEELDSENYIKNNKFLFQTYESFSLQVLEIFIEKIKKLDSNIIDIIFNNNYNINIKIDIDYSEKKLLKFIDNLIELKSEGNLNELPEICENIIKYIKYKLYNLGKKISHDLIYSYFRRYFKNINIDNKLENYRDLPVNQLHIIDILKINYSKNSEMKEIIFDKFTVPYLIKISEYITINTFTYKSKNMILANITKNCVNKFDMYIRPYTYKTDDYYNIIIDRFILYYDIYINELYYVNYIILACGCISEDIFKKFFKIFKIDLFPYKSKKMIDAAISINQDNTKFQEFAQQKSTDEQLVASVYYNPDNIQFINDNLKTKDMCEYVFFNSNIKNKQKILEHIPKEFKTSYMNTIINDSAKYEYIFKCNDTKTKDSNCCIV